MTDAWTTVVKYWETDPMLVALVASVALMLALILVGFCLVCYTCVKLSSTKQTGHTNKAQSGKMVSVDTNAWSQGFDNALFFCDDNRSPPPDRGSGSSSGGGGGSQILDTRKLRHHDVGHDFMYIARSNSNPINHQSCHSSPICSQLVGPQSQSVCSLVSSVAASTFNPHRDIIHQPAASHAGFASIHRRHVRPVSAYLRQPDARWQRHPPLSRHLVTDERGCGGAVLDLSEEDGETDSSGTVIVTSMDGAAMDSETAFPPPPEDTVDTSTLHRQREPLSDHRRPLSECFMGQTQPSKMSGSNRPHSFMDPSWPAPPPPDVEPSGTNSESTKSIWPKKNTSNNRVKLKVSGSRDSTNQIPLVTLKKKLPLSQQSSSDQTNE